MTEEVWRPVVGLEGRYEVSNCGRVRSLDYSRVAVRGRFCHYRGKVLRSTLHHKGYLIVTIGGKSREVHSLVAEAFVKGKSPERWQVNHKDGVKFHNNEDNLEWITPSGNSLHAYDKGLNTLGERHPNAKLTACVVNEIADWIRSGKRNCDISRAFALPSGTVDGIRAGRAWRRVTGFVLRERRAA